MEDSHYCLKGGSTLLGLDNYINHRKVPCDSVASSKIYDETLSCDGSKIEMDGASTAKIDGGNRDSGPETDKKTVKVEADDFFSSLELQSSSKTSTNPANVSVAGKSSGGIVTRSKSLLSYQDMPKHTEKVEVKGGKTRVGRKKGKKRRLLNPRRKATKRQGSGVARMEESNGPSPGLDRTKEDDEWNLFNHLVIKKDLDEKRVEATGSIRRYTPELFSMSPILINDELSEDKDVEVDKFLENEDYDDDDAYLNLEDVDEFNYAPPRCHTGGKWKPGSLTVRTSPVLWTSQTWDSLLDEDGRNSSAESPTELERCKALPPLTGGKWKSYNPPSTYTGGKWKPSETPPVKKQQDVPPATYTGGKWHPGKRMPSEPPATHTGGKWKPQISPDSKTWKNESDSAGKCSVDNKTLNVIASCQSTSGKCLKTAGGLIQYYCSPCNRRLASKKMYKKHVLSELHLKRVLQENELEFDSRSIKMFRGLYSVMNNKERGLGKREIKKPEFFKDMDMGTGKRAPKDGKSDKVKRKRLPRREFIRCDICKTKLLSHQLGKHLVSYYHSRRIRLDDPEQQKLVLDNIHAIVKQAPYQCGICKFYFNTHGLFKKHWSSSEHKMEEGAGKKFWCVLCNFECDTSRSMELHLDSNSHREVIMAVNKSIPIIIRQKQILNCKFCDKKFRYNFALIRHNRISHGLNESESETVYHCQNCKFKARTIKSLQRHVLRRHKSNGKVPYFCSVCETYFPTSEDARNHRKSQAHRLRRKKGGNQSKRPCPHCPTIADDLGQLKTHIESLHPSLRPKCSKCGTPFCLPQEVAQHAKTCSFANISNQPSDTHRCNLCGYSSALKSDVMYHEILHDKQPGEFLSCPVCCKPYRIAALKVHLRTHTGERPYSCKTCSKTFIRKTRLMAHLKFDHVEEEEEEEVEEEESKKPAEGPKCGDSKCKYVAKDAEDMEYHSRVHIARKVFQCPSCYYKAKTNTLLKRHNKIHIDERSFPCPHCPFRGRLASHLKRHLRLHTGAKPYKCPHCPYQCNILENLRKHVLYTKIHPGKMLYECKMCEYTTNASKEFKQHLFDKHGDKFGTEVAITAYMAGIYNVDEDIKAATNPVPKTIPKTDKSTVRKSIAILSKKETGKTPGNLVQDRRKVLEMELEKLKKQAKKKPLKSYPAAKVLRELRPKLVTKSPDGVATKTEQGSYLTVAINQMVSQPDPGMIKVRRIPNRFSPGAPGGGGGRGRRRMEHRNAARHEEGLDVRSRTARIELGHPGKGVLSA